jgi:hypothetical protein
MKPISSAAYAFMADGGGGSGGDVTAVRSGTGIQVENEEGPEPVVNLHLSYTDNRYVNEGQVNSVDTEMIVPDVVSSIDDVSNDGGNIDLAAGAGIDIDSDDVADVIIISATELGDVTDVFQGTGITVSNQGGPQPTVSLNTSYTDDRYLKREPDYSHYETVTAGNCETWTHSVGGDASDYIVIMDGRASGSTRWHQANFGTNPVSWIPERWVGAEWYNLTSTQITVCRGDFDNDGSVPTNKQWDYIRIRIWKNQ